MANERAHVMRLTAVLPEEDAPHHRDGRRFPATTPSPNENNKKRVDGFLLFARQE